MPDFFPVVPGLTAFGLMLGIVAGWFIRGSRVKREKAAIHAGWQDQMAAQSNEHGRVAEQNTSLMDQISQYRSAKKDADARAKELSDSLKESLERRDELQKQLRELRSNLEVAVRQRDKAKAASDSKAAREQSRDKAMREKDEKIFKLSRELESWRDRLPPLLEKYRQRDLEAQQLEIELDKATSKLAELESRLAMADNTRVEPIEDASLAERLAASNEQFEEDGRAEQAVSGEHRLDEPQPGNGTNPNDAAVDYDLGRAADETPVDGGATDASMADVFEDESGIADIDELLETGVTPAIDADTLNETGHGIVADTQDFAHAMATGDTGLVEAAAEELNGHGHDDLQQIKGVGPAIEKTLNDLGIFRFEQIAGLSEVEIDRVARELRGFRSRIYREDWIGQARMLQHEKAGHSG